jgi:hypothetical protein
VSGLRLRGAGEARFIVPIFGRFVLLGRLLYPRSMFFKTGETLLEPATWEMSIDDCTSGAGVKGSLTIVSLCYPVLYSSSLCYVRD